MLWRLCARTTRRRRRRGSARTGTTTCHSDERCRPFDKLIATAPASTPALLKAARAQPVGLNLAHPPEHALIHRLALPCLLPRRLALLARAGRTRRCGERGGHAERMDLARPALVGGARARERRVGEAVVVGERDAAQVGAVVDRDGGAGKDGVGRLQDGVLAARVDELAEAVRELGAASTKTESAFELNE